MLRKILAILLSYTTNLPLTYLETKIGIKNLHRVTKSHIKNFTEHLISSQITPLSKNCQEIVPLIRDGLSEPAKKEFPR